MPGTSLHLWVWKLESESCSVISNSLQIHELVSTRLLCPWNSLGKNTGVGCHFLLQLFPRVCSNSCPLSQWCHLTISPYVTPFFSYPQSFLVSGFFPMSQLFVWSDQSTGALALALVLPMNIQGWFPLGTGDIKNLCLQSGLVVTQKTNNWSIK